jgi:hypothetical protein
MAANPLYRLHAPALAATHSDLENHALAIREVLTGTPGGVVTRRNATGTMFYARQYYDHDRVKRDRYLAGPAGSPQADALAESWRIRIAEANDILKSVKILMREGYLALGHKPFAALAPLCSHGLFAAGALLVGTHAFASIVNRMGIRVSAFPTEDIDIARPEKLALASVPPGGFLEILRESGIKFVPIPEFDPHTPSTKFKEAGRSRLQVDLLVPAAGKEVSIRPVPELDAHATALPFLSYLLAESQPGIVLSHHGVAAVRTPLPERYAVHKLLVSQLRTGRTEKSLKDLRQAAILIAAMAELFPGAITEAFGKLPVTAHKYVRKSLMQVTPWLEVHPKATEELLPFMKGGR